MELRADVVVVGGGVGGCAAALAAARMGSTVIVTEETDWIGGQLTQQAVPPDEHPWIEQFGCSTSYRAFRNGVRDYYRANYPLTAEARAIPDLNPGNGGVSRLCHEPKVALAVLNAMLAPWCTSGQITVLLNTTAVRADVDGDRVASVVVRGESGFETTLVGKYVLDATEMGDLLPMTGTEYVAGFEAQSETGELHAPSEAQPDNHQSFTCCFAMDHVAGEDHTIEKPASYAFWRDYVPELTPKWPGKLLHWAYSHPHTCDPTERGFAPDVTREEGGFWIYRRILEHRYMESGGFRDICLVNWPQIDYWLGNLCEVSDEEAAQHLQKGKELSLSWLHWMQTEAPRSDGGLGWPGLRLRKDVVGTEDGLAKYPYIRESRRIRAEFTVVEEHVGTEARMKATGLSQEDVVAEVFEDTVGVGSYRIDLHPSSGGDNYIDVSSLPFQIPLGSLIPVRMENLLPACKNLGVTHITNGCYRLHPVEWGIGEAAGVLAAYCASKGESPRGVRNTEARLKDLQGTLRNQGVELEWPRLRPR